MGKITLEVEAPEGADSIGELLKELKRGIPLNTRGKAPRRTRLYEGRARY